MSAIVDTDKEKLRMFDKVTGRFKEGINKLFNDKQKELVAYYHELIIEFATEIDLEKVYSDSELTKCQNLLTELRKKYTISLLEHQEKTIRE